MKKFASLLLTLSLVMGVATVAFAQDPPKDKSKTEKPKKDKKKDKDKAPEKKPA